MGVWVCGCVGVWVCGCMGVWVCGCVGVGVGVCGVWGGEARGEVGGWRVEGGGDGEAKRRVVTISL